MHFKLLLTQTLCVLTLSTASFAQKVDLDPWRFTTHFRHLPTKPLGADFTTYNVVVSAPGNVKNNFSEETLKEKVRLDGFRRVDTHGHLTVSVNLSDVFITETKVEERIEEQKNKEGKVTGRTYYYKPTARYTFDAAAEVKNYKSERIAGVTMAQRGSSFSWQGSEGTSSKDAYDYLNNNRGALRDQFTRERVEAALNTLSANIGENYGFPIYTNNQQLYLLDNKKHPEYEGHQKVVNFVKETLTKDMKGDVQIDDIKAKFEPLRTYLEETVKKYSKDDKSEKKMRYAAYYALAKISYWLDDPDACIKYSESLIANEYDEKDGKTMIEDAKALKEAFSKNNMKSRHFPIDVSVFEAPK